MARLAIIFHSTYAPKTTGQDQTAGRPDTSRTRTVCGLQFTLSLFEQCGRLGLCPDEGKRQGLRPLVVLLKPLVGPYNLGDFHDIVQRHRPDTQK